MYDLVLTGGLVVDGTGAEPYQANVCVKGGKIARITAEAVEGGKVLDVSGRVVSPGFVDIHSHSDCTPLVSYIAESKITQGVTTELVGNCGDSCLPCVPERMDDLQQLIVANLQTPLHGTKASRESITDYIKDANAKGMSTNYALLVGHSALRIGVMGFDNREPNEQELEQLKSVLEREMQRGVFGMSLGLIYPPSAFSTKHELVELAKVVKKYDGIVSVHMRNEAKKVFEAVDEMLEIAEESGVHLQISHLKLMGKPQWGRSGELLAKIEAARERGINVTCDQYPFTASSTSLSAVVPNWAHEGGKAGLLARLNAPTDELKTDIAKNIEERGGANTILVIGTNSSRPEYEGRYVSEMAEAFGMDPVDATIKILIDADTVVKCVFFCMDEGDVMNIMPRPYVCVGSDGYAFSYDPKWTPFNPHPRSFATYPQFFQMMRETGLMNIQQAVYKTTGLPAKFMGLKDRGILKEGYAADITVFDPETIENKSTYMDSKIRPAGIDYVIVAGEVVMERNVLTDARPGQILLSR